MKIIQGCWHVETIKNLRSGTQPLNLRFIRAQIMETQFSAANLHMIVQLWWSPVKRVTFINQVQGIHINLQQQWISLKMFIQLILEKEPMNMLLVLIRELQFLPAHQGLQINPNTKECAIQIVWIFLLVSRNKIFKHLMPQMILNFQIIRLTEEIKWCHVIFLQMESIC